MDENTPIQEIRERLSDLIAALEEAGEDELARGLKVHARGFTEMGGVRRSVQAIYEQLQHWRQHPEELTESASIEIAGNLLEDACKAALKRGVIIAARPSLAAQAKRKLSIAVYAAIGTGIVFAVPVGMMMLGIDIMKPITKTGHSSMELPQVEERTLEIEALAHSDFAEHTTGVEFRWRGGCDGIERNGITCTKVEARFWEPGRLPTFEVKLAHQAYGFLFALHGPNLANGLAYSTLLMAATNDSPPGKYMLHFEVDYIGYTPVACGAVQRLMDECPEPKLGKDARHRGVVAATLEVNVVRGSPESRLAGQALVKREEVEARKLAEERAGQIMGVLTGIEAAIKVTDKAIKRRKWREVRERLAKLAVLFEPLDVMLADPDAGGSLPQEVLDVREHYGDQSDALKVFEDDAFNATFRALNVDHGKGPVDEEKTMARVAKRKNISPEYLEEIYTERPDEIELRHRQLAAEHLAAKRLEEKDQRARCGELVGGGWDVISTYLKKRFDNEHVETRLGECLSARLTDDCWYLSCAYKKRVTVSELHPSQTRDFRGTFNIRAGKVLGYKPE